MLIATGGAMTNGRFENKPEKMLPSPHIAAVSTAVFESEYPAVASCWGIIGKTYKHETKWTSPEKHSE
jgi:hypothetical protein